MTTRRAVLLAVVVLACLSWSVLLVVGHLGGRGGAGTQQKLPSRLSPEEEKAVGIAVAEVGKYMELPNVADVQIERRDQGHMIVTWPVRRSEPSLGPEYYARVDVDLNAGRVVRIDWGN